MQPKLTSNDFLHLEWNSKLIPKLVDLSVVEYSVSKAFIIEHEISSWNIKRNSLGSVWWKYLYQRDRQKSRLNVKPI